MTPAVRPHGYLEGVPTVNDRTRPPLDVEALAEAILHVVAENSALDHGGVDDDKWDFGWLAMDDASPLYVARKIAAAYQPTGPDDLAGLREAVRLFITLAQPSSELPNRYIVHRRDLDTLADALARGVTLTGVRSSEVDRLREAADRTVARLITHAAATVRGDWTCEKGHRNGEANPHIHFDDMQIARGRMLAGWANDLRRALTGDTGPKVEPEP